MISNIRKYFSDESGEVTIEWVLLTAGVVGISIAALTIIAGGIGTSAHKIAEELGGAGLVFASSEDDGGGGNGGSDEDDDEDDDKDNCGRGSQKDHEPGPNGRNNDKCH